MAKVKAATNNEPTNPTRLHRATYARDKLKGGYIIRVGGPNAAKFAGREVPVTRKDGSETTEKLNALIHTGMDDEAQQPYALYSFEQKPKEKATNDIPF